MLFDTNIKQFAITTNYLDENPDTEGIIFDELLKALGGDILEKCVSDYRIKKAHEGWITKKDLWSEINVAVNKIERVKIGQQNFYAFLKDYKTKKITFDN